MGQGLSISVDEETVAEGREETQEPSNIIYLPLRRLFHKTENLEALALKIIEANKVPYQSIGFAPAFSRLMFTNMGVGEDGLGVKFYTDLSNYPDCGNIASKCVETAFEECENPGSLAVLRTAKITDSSVQNFIVLLPKNKGLVKNLQAYKGRGLTQEEIKVVGGLLAEAGAIQVDATPWYEKTTNHQISKIHEIITAENLEETVKKEKQSKKSVLLGVTSIITTLDRYKDLWLEGYMGVPGISANHDNTLSFTPQICIRACRTVVDKDEMRLALDAHIPNQKRLNEVISECPETEPEKIFEYLRMKGALIPRITVVKKDPERSAKIAENVERMEQMKEKSFILFCDGGIKKSTIPIKAPELFEETHNYSCLDSFAEQGELEAALARNLKRNYGALIGAIRALPSTMLSVVDNLAKQTLLLDKNSLGGYINVDERIMGSNISEEIVKTLKEFPRALTSKEGTLLWKYKPTRFPLTELVEGYSLVRGVTYKAWGVDCYGAQLMVKINKTEENKALLEKYRKDIEGLSNDNVSVSVDSFNIPSIRIRTPIRVVGENTTVDVAATIAKFSKVEEKILEMTYELR